MNHIEEEYKKIASTFNSGGFPQQNYVKREEVEKKLMRCINEDKLLIISGRTKVGKTVLIQNRYGKETDLNKGSVWISCSQLIGKNEEYCWGHISNKLKIGDYKIATSNTLQTENKKRAQLAASLGVSGAKIEAKGDLTAGTQHIGTINDEVAIEYNSNKDRVLDYLDNHPNATIIFDDIHLIDFTIRKNIVKAIKPLVQKGRRIIFILIPSRENEVGAEYIEMNNRYNVIHFTKWSNDEISKIASQGFSTLNIQLDDEVLSSMTNEAKGNPQLMQEFCKSLSYTSLEEGRFTSGTTLTADATQLEQIFRDIAKSTGNAIFEQVQGLGRKGKRLKYHTLTAPTIEKDVYDIVMDTLAENPEPTDRYETHKLRELISQKLVPNEIIHPSQISHVIKSLANINSEGNKADNESCKIIDYVPRSHQFYIIDPFFSFYLKWGRL